MAVKIETSKSVPTPPKAVKKKKEPDTCSLNFQSADGLQKAFGDLELDESVTFTVKGKVKSLRMSNSAGQYDNYQSSSMEVEISSVSGVSETKEENDKEMNDMTKED